MLLSKLTTCHDPDVRQSSYTALDSAFFIGAGAHLGICASHDAERPATPAKGVGAQPPERVAKLPQNRFRSLWAPAEAQK